MKKILIFSLAAMLGLVTCTERPEQIIDPVYDRLFSPTDVKAEVQAIVNATVTWKEVEHASGYTLELFNAPEPAEGTTPYRIDETEGTSFRYENLPEDVEFAVRIKAVSENLPESKWTALVTFKTTPPPPPVTTEWNFSDDEFAEIPTTNDYKQTLTVRGLDVVGGTGGVGRTTVNVAIDDYTFTWRLDLRGGGAVGSDLASSNRVIHVKADNPCVITVYAHSSSAGRTLKITDKNDNTLGEYLTTGTTPGKVDVNVAEATDIYIYSAGSGIEVYLVKMVVGGVYEPDHTATLRALAVTGETLVPAFDPETTNYTIGVAKSVEKVTITTAKGHPNQTVEGDGEHPLTGDVTAIPVRVTAEDGTTVNTYTITVNREATASSDATLKTLTASPGNLTPAFDPAVTEYEVTTTAEKVTITAEASHKFAKVGNSGSFEADNLVVSVPSIVTIPVLAEDLTTKIYTVTVTRQETPSSGGPTTKMWNFSDAVFQTLPGTFTTDYTIDGLQIIAGGSEMRYNANGKSMDGYVFTHRLQYNGAGDITKRALKFDVDGPSTITAYMITGSGTDVRELVVHDGTNELGRLATDGTSNINKYVHNYTGGAGSIYIYSLAGINIYGLKVETISGGDTPGGGGDDGGNSAWTKVDIGANSGGDKSVSGGILTLTGKGKWESSDQSFTYLYMQKTGDFTATVRVQNYTTTAAANNAGQAGLLLTSDITQTGNNFLHMQAGVQNGFAATVYSRRLTTDINASRGTITAGGTGSDYVLKLVRSGTSISLYASKDGGVTYGNASTQTIASLSESVYIGVAVNSNSNSDTGTATFSDFKIDDTPMPFE